MGTFYFDGKNKILQDMIQNLPSGKVYYKEANVIPYIDSCVFSDFCLGNSMGDVIDIYVNNESYGKAKVLNDKSIYYKMKTPYGRFKVCTKFNGTILAEYDFTAINVFTFLLIIAKEFNYDYLEMFKIFGNLYFNTLQDDMIYKKYGWFFDLVKGTFTAETYRRIVIGDGDEYLGTVKSFMHAATLQGIIELVKSFTTREPIIKSYKDFDGWVLRDSSVYPLDPTGNAIWQERFFDFLLVNTAGDITDPANSSRIRLMDKTFKMRCITIEIQFWPTEFNNDTHKDILNELIYKIVPANLKVEIVYP